MPFNAFLSQAWNDHAANAPLVANRLPEGIQLIKENNQIPMMAQLITHVLGEHLGQWDTGVKLLNGLYDLPFYDPQSDVQKTLKRSIAMLEFCSGKRRSLEEFSVSDRIRIMASAAAAFCEQKDPVQSRKLFNEALNLARGGLVKEDPANRVLAITGNNLASSLEEKAQRTDDERQLMIMAAQTARTYWEIAGTWLEVERAEYRLAHTYLKAGDLAKALKHAQSCLEIVVAHKASALELFFGYEALALAEKALDHISEYNQAVAAMKIHFEALDPDDKTWTQETLNKVLGE